MTQSAAGWPTHAFEVQLGGDGVTGALESLFSGEPDDPLSAHIADIESYLSEVARELDRLGFRAPPMARGERGYVVRLFDYDDGVAYLRAGFGGQTCGLHLDLSRVIVNGKLERRVLENLGHELFHCVQFAYPMFGADRTVGDWIVEATAQAIGQDLLWQLRRQEYSRREPQQRWGGRQYQRRLALPNANMPRPNFHYYTESLWRYLGEQFAAKGRGGRAGVEVPPPDRGPDHSWLHALFLHPISGSGEAAELTWADEGIEAIFGVGLDRLYPDFVSTFAGYVPARVGTSATQTPHQMRERWTDLLFGACKTGKLDLDAPLADVELDMAPVSTRCIRLTSSIADQVDVSIHVHGESRTALRSLVIGTAGGERVGQPVIFGPPTGGGLMAYWVFRLGLDPAQTLIVSNVFEDVAATPAQKLRLKVSVNGWMSSATQPVPETPASSTAPATASAPGAKAKGAAPDPTRAAAAARVATGLDSLSAHAINGLGVGFNHDEPLCDEPFRFGPCGPNTTIRLSLAPGSVGGFEHTTGTGGQFGQFLSTLQAVGDHGLAASSDGMSAAAQAIARTKGSTVTIVMPAIDYGFSGTLDGIAIRVNGEGGDDLEAIEPRDALPGPGRAFPLSGRVTIEEFTPFVLRGSFNAPVVNTSRLDQVDLGDDPVLEISEEISGRFVIGAPWRGDPRVEPVRTEDPAELAARDLAEFMPLPEARSAATAKANATTAADAPGSTVGYTVQPMHPFPACECACAPGARFAPPCHEICEPAVQHCAALESYRATSARLLERDAAITTAAEGLRTEFDAFMRARNYDPAYRDALLGAFDQQTNARDKRNFARSMGMPLEQLDAEVDPAVARILAMTREEYIAELDVMNVPAARHAELLEIFDEVKRREAAKSP